LINVPESVPPVPATPTSADAVYPFVVGIGASAGGIAALRDFFANVPSDTDAAYCVVLHLSPDHESQLAEILQHTSPIPVEKVAGAARIAPGRVYVIPPNFRLSITDGTLHLHTASTEDRRIIVDLFFESLAEARGSNCAVAVLSGTGHDGSAGVKRVKERGGLVLVQVLSEAQHQQMPESALRTGVADIIAPVAEMPARITEYHGRLRTEAQNTPLFANEDLDEVHEVLRLLRLRTGHDFSSYKTPTLIRRIRRRAHVRNAASIADYASVLRDLPEEAPALMKDLLISVTRFFRNPEAFAAVAQIGIPRLFRDRVGSDHVRVWVVACASGEEAYSVAMLLAEEAGQRPQPPSIQVFATDLDADAVAVAREGFYSEADVREVGEVRLRRFFNAERGGYRVRRELREMVLFATHNVIRDPPFSHLDMVTCRNLLIYLNRTAQARVLDTFHFALRAGGYLWLGQSETADAPESPFVLLDKAAHLYEGRGALGGAPSPRPSQLLPHARMMPHVAEEPPKRIPPGVLHHRLVEQYVPPSVLISDDFQVLHLSEHAGRFMSLVGGELTSDFFHLVRPELKSTVRRAVRQAAETGAPVEVKSIPLPVDGRACEVHLTVRPTRGDGRPPRRLFLITFDSQPETPVTLPAAPLADDSDIGARHLEDELAQLRAQLRATVEQYETQHEEARAANEELQAMNEELRSAAEELETGKEELQSVNEELSTVNQELKVKINELAETNNDFQNLIAATEIGTIFLDSELRIKFSTPAARAIFNLQESDVGRPLSDITNQLHHHTLHEDVVSVLEHLSTIDRELETGDGRWHLMRVRPYAMTDGPANGVVITFQDITHRHATEVRALQGEERLRLLIDSAIDYAIFTMTPDGVIDFWNVGAQRMFGYTADEIIGQDVGVLFTPEDRAALMPEQERTRAARSGRAADQRFHVRKDGSRIFCSGVLTLLGKGRGFAKIARDLTGPREAAASLATLDANTARREKANLSHFQAQVQNASIAYEDAVRRIVNAQETERARIARDLHDSLGQMLTALRLTLERGQIAGPGEPLNSDVERAMQLTSAIDRELDFLSRQLRPAVLEELGLAAALPLFLREWSEHYHVQAEYRSAFEPGHLSADAEVAFYRVAQEALNNVTKHARATRVDVILETREGQVVLLVEDNGVGFDVADEDLISRRFGVVGMRERAALIGATLDIESAAHEGTSVFLRCPVAPTPV
jgi:two-component system, chemotaxis family, CheB/CheR fusion protein